GGSASGPLVPYGRPNKPGARAKLRKRRRPRAGRRYRERRWTTRESWLEFPRWRAVSGSGRHSALWRAGSNASRAELACIQWRAIRWDTRNVRRGSRRCAAAERRLLLELEPGAWLSLLSRVGARRVPWHGGINWARARSALSSRYHGVSDG